MRGKLDIAGLALGFVGLVGAAVATGLPIWKDSAFVGANLIVMETQWDGLWMSCVTQVDVRMQCKTYDSQLELAPELQAARGLMCVSLPLAVAALLASFCGTRRTTCFGEDAHAKRVTLALGGGLFLLACLAVLVAVCWTAHGIVRNFYDPEAADSRKHELGASLYLGWASAAALLAAGIVLLYRATARSRAGVQPVPPSEARNVELEHPLSVSGSYRKSQYV